MGDQQPAVRHVLVTAFEPFGTEGRPNRGANASEEVLRAWLGEGREGVRTAVLPVSTEGETVLARLLADLPGIVVATGEAAWPEGPDTVVERWAEDRPVATGDPRGGAPRLLSRAAPLVEPLEGMETRGSIGQYWCNRAYFRVLRHAQAGGIPAVFLHFRVEGRRTAQEAHLDHVVATLRRLPPVPTRGSSR